MYLSGRAQRLIKLLKWCADHWQHVFPKQKWLAAQLDCSVRTVKRALAELRGQWVAVKRRYRRSSVYRLLEAVTDQQMTMFPTEEITVEISMPKHTVPILGPTVVTRTKPLLSDKRSTLCKDSAIQYHPADDAEPSREAELKRLAGLPGKRLSAGDRSFLDALQQPEEVIRAGILLGRARKLVQRANTRTNEPIRSLRYFAATIREAESLPLGYIQHLEGFIRRHERAS